MISLNSVGIQRSTLLLGICALLLLGLVMPSFVYANTDVIGSAALTSTFYVFALSQITPSGSGPLQSIGVNLANTGGGNVEVAIYSDVSGAPGSLIAQSTSTPLNAGSGWQDVPTPSTPTINGGTHYWIGLIFDNSVRTAFYMGGTGTTYLSFSNYGPWPTSYPLNYPLTYTANLRITYSTGPPAGDFSIQLSPTSQTVGAGSTAFSTVTLTAGSGYSSSSISLSVLSGCPTGGVCTVTPSTGISLSGTTSASLTVATTVQNSGTFPIVVQATDGTHTHSATFTLTINGPQSFNFNVKAGATSIVVTVTWTGSGATTVAVSPPPGTTVIYDTQGQTYDRTSIAVTGPGQSTTSNIHRATFTSGSLWTSPASLQVWTLYVSGPSAFTVTVEVT